jgi:hypothetical protein
MLPAGIGYVAGCRLVTVLVGSRGRVGLVTPIPNGHLPALFGGPFHAKPGEWFFFLLDRAVGVDLELLNREEVRMAVPVPQHQAAVYETHNQKGYRHPTARHVIS